MKITAYDVEWLKTIGELAASGELSYKDVEKRMKAIIPTKKKAADLKRAKALSMAKSGTLKQCALAEEIESRYCASAIIRDLLGSGMICFSLTDLGKEELRRINNEYFLG